MANLCTFDCTLTSFDSTARTFDATTCQQQQIVILGGGDGISWEDYVTAEFRRKHLQVELKKEERKLKTVERQLKRVEEKLPEQRTEGILANLQRLAFKKDEIQNRIEALRVEMVPLDKFIEAEIEEDDQEVMALFH